MIEYKCIPAFTKIQDDRTVKGYAAVLGHIDSVGDRLHPGAFANTLKKDKRRIKHLWQHDASLPPIAVIKSLREVGRAELPDGMRKQFPDATGALEVTREYLNTPRADEILKAIKAGAISEMSFGFDIVQWAITTADKQPIRELREVRLWDTSDVLWGAQDSTIANLAAKAIFGMQARAQRIRREIALAEAELYLYELDARMKG